MGILGLTEYFFKNEKLYFKRHELSDCLLVIDGGYVSNVIYHSLTLGDGESDYDEYYAQVKNFMLDLKKCNIEPIILLDGTCEPTKIEKRLERRNQLLKRTASRKNFKMCPLLFMEVFLDVMRDIGFYCAQCINEADAEIAAVASSLACPILSFDSDYFFFDAPYIPFLKLNKTPVKHSESGKYYMDCIIYNINDFLSSSELDKSLLPLIATILGNDHGNNELFNGFLNYLGVRGKNISPKLIAWLKTQTLKSAVETITRFMNSENVEKFSEALCRNQKFYNNLTISTYVFNDLSKRYKMKAIGTRDLNLKWPLEITKLCAQTWIPNFIMTIALHQFYITPLQKESTNCPSSHLQCLKLIMKIYEILCPYLKNKKPLSVYLNVRTQYVCIQVPWYQYPGINLDKALKEPKEMRLKLLCDAIGIPMEKVKIVPFNSWAVITLSFIYWVKELKTTLSHSHVEAFVIMTIANKIVQTKVGHYKDIKDFTNHYRDDLGKLKDAEIALEQSNDFEEMVKNVNFSECLLLQNKLIHLRRSMIRCGNKEDFISIIHLFNCFQTCLFYTMIINSLFNYPLPHVKVADFYSGTLLFNLYVLINSQSKFGSGLFQNTPNANKIYNYLLEKLSKFLF